MAAAILKRMMLPRARGYDVLQYETDDPADELC